MQRALLLLAVLVGSLPALLAQASVETRRVLHVVSPKYPADAKAQHLAGRGIFSLHIRTDGTIERVETLQSIGHQSLDAAAVAALRQWIFPRYDAPWTLGVPIRYVDGPPSFDKSLDRPPCQNCLKWVSVFSRSK